MNTESDLLGAIVAGADLCFEKMNVVFTIMAVGLVGKNTEGVKSGVAIAPHLQTLNGTNALDLSKAISTPMDVCPCDIDIVVIDKIPSAQIALKLHGTLDTGELVLDLHVLIMDTDAFIIGVLDSVLLSERYVSFRVAWVIVLAMTRVQCVRVYLVWEIRGNCEGSVLVLNPKTAGRGKGARTIMLEKLILIAALPKNTALLRPHDLPRPEINDLLVRSVLKQSSARRGSVRKHVPSSELLPVLVLHCCLISRGPEIQRLRDGGIGGGCRYGRDAGGRCPSGIHRTHVGTAIVGRRTTKRGRGEGRAG